MQKSLNLQLNWKKVASVFAVCLCMLAIAIFFLQRESSRELNDTFHTAMLVIIGMMLVTLLMTYSLLFLLRVDIKWVFLVTALTLGISYNLFLPVMNTPDEDYHSAVAQALASEWMGQTTDSPDSLMMMTEGEKDPGLRSRSLNREYYNEYYQWMTAKTTSREWVEKPYIYHAEFYRIIYAPSALGIILGRVLGFRLVGILMLGRFFNLLFFLLCGYYAIWRSPIGRELMMVFSMMPMLVQQVNSYSTDSTVAALTLAFMGATFSLAYRAERDKWTKLDLLVALLSGIILGRCKYAACLPICLLILLVAMKKRRADRKLVFCAWGILFASVMLGTLPGIYTMVSDNTVLTPVLGTVPYYTIGELLSNPYRLFEILGNTFYYRMDDYWRSVFGYSLGLYEWGIRLHQAVLFVPLLFLSVVPERGQEKPHARERALFFLVTFLGIAFAMGGMLIGWTPNTEMQIGGVQGRYFHPFIVTMMLCLAPHMVCVDNKDIVRRRVLMTTIIVQFVSVLTYLDVIGGLI